jgi:hypothetical protein
MSDRETPAAFGCEANNARPAALGGRAMSDDHFPSAFFILSTLDFTTYWQ